MSRSWKFTVRRPSVLSACAGAAAPSVAPAPPPPSSVSTLAPVPPTAAPPTTPTTVTVTVTGASPTSAATGAGPTSAVTGTSPTSAATGAGPTSAAAPAVTSGSRIVTGMAGEQITVPPTTNRIAEQFPAHTITDLMLGVGPQLVAIPLNVKSIPFLRKVYPPIDGVPELFRNGGAVNMEDLLKLKPDVVSTLDNGATLRPFQTVSLPAIYMGFNTFPQLTQSITVAGNVYGGAAVTRAADYNKYFSAKYALVQDRLATLTPSQRPSVVHIASYPPLIIDGRMSIIDQWITLAGGTDLASSLPGAGTHAAVTMEQMLSWNPDIIIVETPGGDQGLAADTAQSVVVQLEKEPLWRNPSAVTNNRVLFNPQGLYPRDRFGPEEALQIQWAASVIHPEVFGNLDLRAEARTFYHTYFNYDLTDGDLDQIFQVSR
jgi:iron complex transport system substrate-binding protein